MGISAHHCQGIATHRCVSSCVGAQLAGLYDSLPLQQCGGCRDYPIGVLEGPNRHAPNAVSVFLHCAVSDRASAGAYSGETQRSGGLIVKRCSPLFSAADAKGEGTACAAPRGAPGSTRRSPAGLDISDLEKRAAAYFQKGLADSSHRTYRSGENRYLRFCQLYDCAPLPVSEDSLCKFVSYLGGVGLKHRTIKTYLSGVRFLQIRAGYPDFFRGTHTPRLDYTLRGVKRVEAEQGGSQDRRLPVTPSLLRRMRGVWASRSSDPDVKMLWAACCLGFFGFLRVGEMTAPQQGVFDPDVHLGFADIAVDDPVTPSFIRVTIKQSKTDPFRQGVQLFIGRTQSDLCPVAAMLGYLDVRGSGPGPLFRFVDGAGLTRSRFVAQIREALRAAGVDESRYNGHSFRIGAATTAAARGIEDCVIKTLGRWESAAYLQYVRIPRRELTGYSRLLGAPEKDF